jgi:hypothetical protein
MRCYCSSESTSEELRLWLGYCGDVKFAAWEGGFCMILDNFTFQALYLESPSFSSSLTKIEIRFEWDRKGPSLKGWGYERSEYLHPIHNTKPASYRCRYFIIIWLTPDLDNNSDSFYGNCKGIELKFWSPIQRCGKEQKFRITLTRCLG